MTASCAICVAHIPRVTRREPLGRDDGMVAVCDGCAKDPIVETRSSRGRVSTGIPSDPRAARIKEHRDDLARRGICTNGEKHGPATHGRLCAACGDRQRTKDRTRRPRNQGARP